MSETKMMSAFCVSRLGGLLRYARKSSGFWDECDVEGHEPGRDGCWLPDETDAALIVTAVDAFEPMREALKQLKWAEQGRHQPDHACAECVPGGEILIDGFRCGLHAARAALKLAGET